ncbi:hypothetical protein [uncultured Pseudacidovorax sp.]|uniref:hypothetical protein n=1 Tax=uncultured Pseudacidovorax sp. TaxID=679313 RepID=UPI0025DEFB89|nr:hypothetical protein [uncultured Pseudacidovorax sp.]
MGQAAKKVNLREDMPETAAWVDQRRKEWGVPYVNDCIRRAIAGEPGLFYALERGHVLGTPFPATHPVAELQHQAVLKGSTFAGFMAEPKVEKVEDGKA